MIAFMCAYVCVFTCVCRCLWCGCRLFESVGVCANVCVYVSVFALKRFVNMIEYQPVDVFV